MSNGNGSGNGGTVTSLTAQERQVLEHAAKGVTRVRDLARELGMSSEGVRKRINRILVKLGVDSLQDAILKASAQPVHAGVLGENIATSRRYSSNDPNDRKFHVAHTGD